ncbi:MAG: hypothetical protein V1659_02345, partial [Candidatus Woesearchaeota archaeon]
YYNTSIILLATYILAVFVAFVTAQLDYNSLTQMILIGFVSITVISVIVALLFRFKSRLKLIPEQIRKLKI